MSLAGLTGEYNCIAIIGMEKNAGKTTVLNHLLESARNKVTALTSIGYDGEQTDQVTNTGKPAIYVSCGTLIATADSLLNYCDVTRELLKMTSIHTSIGEIVIFRALSDGYVRIAGPSITTQMDKVIEMFKAYKAEKIFIDGAAARKSTAAINAADACILATGASYSTSIDLIARQTAFYAELLNLSPVLDKQICELFNRNLHEEKGSNLCFALLADGKISSLGSSLALDSADEAAGFDNLSAIIFTGALTAKFARRFLEKTRLLKKLQLIVRDGTRILVNLDQYKDFKRRGAEFRVFKQAKLLAITTNPVAPSGFQIDPIKLKKLIEHKTGLPVFDVIADKAEEVER
ncbi:MAG: hypothetical protein ACQETH_09800 [Candidatus Rifleibacteriota bacterium]